MGYEREREREREIDRSSLNMCVRERATERERVGLGVVGNPRTILLQNVVLARS